MRTAAERGVGYVEHLLIWSWRRIVTGRADCPVMAQELADACGSDAGEVLLTLCTFLKALVLASRRQLAIRAPDPLGVTSAASALEANNLPLALPPSDLLPAIAVDTVP